MSDQPLSDHPVSGTEVEMVRHKAPSPATARAVVITGGSSGIGLCTAKLFARRGWRVGLIARGAERLEAAAEQIRREGGVVAVATADVADPAALERAAVQLEAALGPIAVWINDAGASFFGSFLDIAEEEFHRVVHTTFLGVVNGTRVALRRMVPRKDGTIINVGSLAAFRGAPLQSPYSASKFAVRGFTEAVRAELIHDGAGVHLGMVHPPSVNTPFFAHAASRMQGEPRPLPPIFQPELIAEAIWLAVMERRREVMVTAATAGTVLFNRLLPGVVDRFMAWSGYSMQRSSSPEVAERRDPALFGPAKRAPEIHGGFGRDAHASSAQMWMQRNRWTVGLSLGMLAVALAPAWRMRRHD